MISIRKSLPVLLFVLLVVVCQSCCTKVDCITILPTASFTNFRFRDIDTVIVYSYKPGTTILIDSTAYFSQSLSYGSDTNTIYLSGQGFGQGADYQINLPNINKGYKIDKFETEQRGCNSCFPYRPKSDYYTAVKGYKINGEYQSSNDGSIKITQ